ncbi:MAG TPA: hypothetical protein PLC79_09820, partial [Phycisphaerae bacterium]|nr:hypothetical protein [Phycisphaerae bacterium]
SSTFVDPEGRPALWHEFGPVEGVGWAANAVGGANELIRYGRFFGDREAEQKGLKVLHHAVYGGFVDGKTGLLRGYRDLRNGRYYLNYRHTDAEDNWLCPGSAAKVALQYIEASDLCAGTRLGEDSLACGKRLAAWLRDNVRLAPNGWFPRRCWPDGQPSSCGPSGTGEDPLFDSSGDGLYLLWLFAEMARRGHADYRSRIDVPLATFIRKGGFYGSMNHDTFDENENVCHAVAFRTLTRIADWGLSRDPAAAYRLAYESLAGLETFEMHEDRNGVATRGLLIMEKSWDTAYLWENAEASLAYLEAAKATPRQEYLRKAITILRAAAKHHYGPYGFLTEGVDWDGHVGQWRVVDGKNVPIHVDGVLYGAINYTEPFLNNLHIVEPTLFYLEHFARRSAENGEERLLDHEGNIIWRRQPEAAR